MLSTLNLFRFLL